MLTADQQLKRAVGTVNREGYRHIHRPAHPIANSTGWAAEHRVVLYDAIGPGEHRCHWCPKTLTWDHPNISYRIRVDHLDNDRLNNTRRNLVPSCLDCNARRAPVPPWVTRWSRRSR